MTLETGCQSAQRFEPFESVRIFPNEPDQGSGLLVRLASTLLPALKGPGIDTQLESEDLARHAERFAGLTNEFRVDGRYRDGLDLVGPKREAPLSVTTHR